MAILPKESAFHTAEKMAHLDGREKVTLYVYSAGDHVCVDDSGNSWYGGSVLGSALRAHVCICHSECAAPWLWEQPHSVELWLGCHWCGWGWGPGNICGWVSILFHVCLRIKKKTEKHYVLGQCIWFSGQLFSLSLIGILIKL